MKNKAKDFIRKYGVHKSNVLSFSFLQDIAVKEHYKVYRPNSSSDEIIEILGMKEYFEAHWAFSYSDAQNKIISIHSSIPDSIAARMLLHELAHIYLHHLDAATIPAESDEAEANMLVDCILEDVYKPRKPSAVSIVLLVISISVLTLSLHIQSDRQNAIETISGTYISSSQVQQSENVFVTKTGRKYHRSDCFHIKDSETVELTISEAEAAGYEPCKDCF